MRRQAVCAGDGRLSLQGEAGPAWSCPPQLCLESVSQADATGHATG